MLPPPLRQAQLVHLHGRGKNANLGGAEVRLLGVIQCSDLMAASISMLPPEAARRPQSPSLVAWTQGAAVVGNNSDDDCQGLARLELEMSGEPPFVEVERAEHISQTASTNSDCYVVK